MLIGSPFCVHSDRLHVEPSAPWHPQHPHWIHAGPDHGGALSGRSLPTSGSAAEVHMDSHYPDYRGLLLT